MFSKILRARHAIGWAGALVFAAIIVSPVRAADDELARYKAAEKTGKAHIAKFDVLDFDVFTNQKWDRLKESHSQDIAVHWPDGHVTHGIDRHIADLKAMFSLEAGVKTGFFLTEADFSSRGMGDFWKQMDKNLWVHPLDQNGVRHNYSAIPAHLNELVDDIYRSVAGYVRDAGGYDKTPTAFAEFVWADFFRRSIPTELVHADFHAAVQTAVPPGPEPLGQRPAGI
jgi:hypothetical protein